jgi:hypothetical protein
MTGPFLAFGEPWFDQHQGRLLCALNGPATRRWARWLLRIPQSEVPLHQDIVAIGPNRYSAGNTTVFRTHPKYAKRLYYALRPGWWLMHGWDWCLPRKSWSQALDFGFATLTAYPDPHPETTTVDGYVYDGAVGGEFPFATLQAGTSGSRTSADNLNLGLFLVGSPTSEFAWMSRIFILFNTASLGAGATISAATLSLCQDASYVGLGAFSVNIVSSSPAANTSLTTADYDAVGSTSFSSLSSFTYGPGSYNNFALNSSGIANISKTGVSKFAGRLGWDFDNSFGGSLVPDGVSGFGGYAAEQSGTASDPKLVVTYTLPIPVFMSQYRQRFA